MDNNLPEEPHMLTGKQKRTFKRNGFLVIPDCVDITVCQKAVNVIWETVPEQANDPATWEGQDPRYLLGRPNGLELTTTQPFEKLLRAVYSYAEALVGKETLASPTWAPDIPCLHAGQTLGSHEWIQNHEGMVEPILRYPEANTTEAWEPNIPHIDGAPGGLSDTANFLPFSIGLTVYLESVPPQGGGFTVWPGSHRTMTEFFESTSFGEYLEQPDQLADFNLGHPFEIAGEQGTVVLWHPALAHAGSKNHSQQVRMVALQRLIRDDVDEATEKVLTDLWGHYDGLPND
jgi:hypothetical protein